MSTVYLEMRSSNGRASWSQERCVVSYKRNRCVVKISFPHNSMFGKCSGNRENIISIVVFTLEGKKKKKKKKTNYFPNKCSVRRWCLRMSAAVTNNPALSLRFLFGVSSFLVVCTREKKRPRKDG